MALIFDDGVAGDAPGELIALEGGIQRPAVGRGGSGADARDGFLNLPVPRVGVYAEGIGFALTAKSHLRLGPSLELQRGTAVNHHRAELQRVLPLHVPVS